MISLKTFAYDQIYEAQQLPDGSEGGGISLPEPALPYQSWPRQLSELNENIYFGAVRKD